MDSSLGERTEEEDVGEIASSSQHPADVASETYEREVDFGLVEDFRAWARRDRRCQATPRPPAAMGDASNATGSSTRTG